MNPNPLKITIACSNCGTTFIVLNTSIAAKDRLCLDCYVSSLPTGSAEAEIVNELVTDYKSKAAGERDE